jgi:hypothetical protein
MSNGFNILPTQTAQITVHPQTNKFYPERLLIKEAAHWKIDAIRVGDRDSALVQNLPGSMFAPDAPGRFPGCGEIEIPPGGELIVGVTYTGLREAGIPFEACVFGSDDRTTMPVASTSRRGEKKIATARSERSIPHNRSTKLSTDPMKRDAWPSRLVIKDASDWVVNDVRVGKVSIFAQAGDVPGSMFSEDAKNAGSAICLGRLVAGDKFSVIATYMGTASDAEFVYELYETHAESEAADLPIAVILPMSTGIPILPSTSAQITGRCQPPDGYFRGIGPRQGFIAERIVVEGGADWVFNDVRIGRTSQFAQVGDVPGLAFSSGTLGGAVSFDAAQAGIDVAIVTTHIGPCEVGAAFVCGILGSLVDLAEVDTSPRRGRILSAQRVDLFRREPRAVILDDHATALER